MKRSNLIGKETNLITTAFIIGAVAFGASFSQAHARMDVSGMSCGEVKSMIKSKKRVTISFSANTYDSVVGSRFLCIGGGGGAERVYTRTADVRSCGIGYRCFQKKSEDKQPEDKPTKTPETPEVGTELF